MGRFLEEPEAGLRVLPPLHAAAWEANLAAVRGLLRAGHGADDAASWTTDTSYGTRFAGVSALHIAVDGCAHDVVAALVQSGAQPALRMSHCGMGYNMGEGDYLNAWDLARRRGGGAVEALEQASARVAGAERSAAGSPCGCIDGLRSLCARL
mmetsp:Transcript_127314/g.396255  ORF Transcript_127314/g.396255 Transcript_127314/m.396255 type:complete len:153 (-) Transcript_127314:63-521(-)